MAYIQKYISSLASGGGDGSIGNPWTWGEMVSDINTGKENVCYNVKADGTYSRTTNVDTISSGGTTVGPVIIRGYSSIIKDGYLGRVNGNGPLVTTNMPSVTYSSGRLNITGSFIVLESLDLSGATTGAGVVNAIDNCLIYSCKISSSATSNISYALKCTGNTVCFNNDIFMTGASGGPITAAVDVGYGRYTNNRVVVQNNQVTCFLVIGANISPYLIGNVCISGGNGISIETANASFFAYQNTFVRNSNAINSTQALSKLQFLANNMITDASEFGVKISATGGALAFLNNRFRNNSSGIYSGASGWMDASIGYNIFGNGASTTDYVDIDIQNANLVNTSPIVKSGIFYPASIGALQFSGSNQQFSFQSAHSFIA